MIILRAFAFIFFNVLAGYIFVFLLKAFLFIPKKEIYLFRRKLPFTPAFIYRKKKWLLRKLNLFLDQYLADTKDFSDRSRITKWESKIYENILEKMISNDKLSWLPNKISQKIYSLFATLGYEIVKQFFRNFVPYLIEHYNLESIIDLIDQKLDIEVIISYFNQYIYKYLMIFTLGFCFMVGLGNMLIFLIVK